MLAIRHLTVVSPNTEKRTVEPPAPLAERRRLRFLRESLSKPGVKKLIEAAQVQQGRGQPNTT